MKLPLIITSKLPNYLLVTFYISYVAIFVAGDDFKCSKEGCGCRCTNGSVTYEISLKGIEAPDGTPLEIPGSGSVWNYFVSTCSDFYQNDNCKSVTMCQVPKDGTGDSFPIARYGKITCENFVEKLKQITVKYDPVGKKQMIINLGCSTTRQDPSSVKHGSGTPETYTFSISTPGGCPKQVAPKPDKKSSDLSAGSILVIVFFAVLVLYLVAGILFMKYKRGATGKEVLPNIEFWSSLPGLIKDGCVFFGKKMKELCGRCCNREGYNEI